MTLGIVSLSKKYCLVIKNRLPIHIIFVDIFGYIQNSNKDNQYKPGQLQRHDDSHVFMATLSQIFTKANFFFFQDKNTDVKRLELAILVNLGQKLRFLPYEPAFCIVQDVIINYEFPIISEK